MSATVLLGGSATRVERLRDALATDVIQLGADASIPDPASVGLVVISADEPVEVAGAGGGAVGSEDPRLDALRRGVLASILPLRRLAAAEVEWCRVVWVLSSSALDGDEPLAAAAQHAALGAMRDLTREFAGSWSTAAVVVDSTIPEAEREGRLAAAVTLLADPGSSFYTGQVLWLRAPDRAKEASLDG